MEQVCVSGCKLRGSAGNESNVRLNECCTFRHVTIQSPNSQSHGEQVAGQLEGSMSLWLIYHIESLDGFSSPFETSDMRLVLG